MKFMRRYFFLVLLTLNVVACYQAPNSTNAVKLPEADRLSDDKKIMLFVESVEKLSGHSYAAVARLNANENNYSSALEAIHEAILEEPMNSYYHSLKANYAYELGDISTAYRESLTAYQLGAKSLDQSLSLAKMGVALSEYSIVNEIIDSLVMIYPNDPQVIYMVARKYEKSGDSTRALLAYRKGIELNADNIENKYYLARLLYFKNYTNEAKEALNDIPVSELNNASMLLLAGIYEDLEVYDTAAILYKQSLTIQKDSLVYESIFRMYKLLGQNDSLISVLKNATVDFPQNKEIMLTTARTLDKEYMYDDALNYYTKLYALDSLDTLVAEELAYLQRKIAYLQRKKDQQIRQEQMIPVQRLTLPRLDSLK